MENVKTFIKTPKGVLVENEGFMVFAKNCESIGSEEWKKSFSKDQKNATARLRFVEQRMVREMVGVSVEEFEKPFWINLSCQCSSNANAIKTNQYFQTLKDKELFISLKNESEENKFLLDEKNIIVVDDKIKKEGLYINDVGVYYFSTLSNVVTGKEWDKETEEHKQNLILKFLDNTTLTRKFDKSQLDFDITSTINFELNGLSPKELTEKFRDYKSLIGQKLLIKVVSKDDKETYFFDREELRVGITEQNKKTA